MNTDKVARENRYNEWMNLEINTWMHTTKDDGQLPKWIINKWKGSGWFLMKNRKSTNKWGQEQNWKND